MGFKDLIAKSGLVEFESETPKDTGEHEIPKNKKATAPKVIPQQSVMSGMGAPVALPYANLPRGTTVTTITSADQTIVQELNTVADGSKRSEYAAFLKVFDSLKGLPDNQRVAMALNVLQGTQNVAPSAVVEAIDDRLALVDNEANEFEAAYQHMVSESVTGVQTQIADIEKQVEAKKAEIEALQQQRIALKQQAGDSQVNLENNRATFLASHSVVHSSLQNERERIITNLPH
jgi:hypothetical protein